jgi:hypothetical protein
MTMLVMIMVMMMIMSTMCINTTCDPEPTRQEHSGQVGSQRDYSAGEPTAHEAGITTGVGRRVCPHSLCSHFPFLEPTYARPGSQESDTPTVYFHWNVLQAPDVLLIFTPFSYPYTGQVRPPRVTQVSSHFILREHLPPDRRSHHRSCRSVLYIELPESLYRPSRRDS